MGECSVKVINEDLTGHPHCSHGPTLLFENINSTSKFYACSALRGKNECKVFVNKDSKKDNVSSHANLPVNKLVEIKKAPHANRVYCHNCGTLSLVEAMNVKKHENHKLHIGIDDDLLKKPTILMNPLSNDKKEAQYFFSQPTLNCIASIFQQLNFGNRKICLFTDPPFGCRTEPLSYTIKLLSKRYQELNSFREVLSVMWIFPYFMETYIKDVMPEMEMIDYKINYTNHELYHDGKKGRKEGSPVRIFSNILSNLIKLPTSEGYWYCQKCQRWSSRENKHCFKCEKCPSKNGSTYVHCELCAICVKPNYKHCTQCNRCTQIAEHKCEEYVKNLRCWICKIRGHNETNCNLWFNRNKKINKNVLQKKSCKIGKKICCICQSKGHNEMQCGTRTKLLNEKYFLSEIFNIFTKSEK